MSDINNNNAATATASSNGGGGNSQTSADSGPPPHNDPVLLRLKELEDSNSQNVKALEMLRKEMHEKEEKIKHLSADKRKEMENILNNAIDKWLSSLSGVSEENKANFRQGISKLAEHADMNNAAWEIVCNASEVHNHNVKQIEELLQQAKEKDRELGDLKGFKTEASRISGVKRPGTFSQSSNGNMDGGGGDDLHHNKMQRQLYNNNPSSINGNDDMVHVGTSGTNNTWDLFQGMLSKDFKSRYY